MTPRESRLRMLTREGKAFAGFMLKEMRPKGKLLTPFNVISLTLMLATAGILAWRFAFGLGTVTNLSQEFPWGIWKGFNVVTGVAFAGGAYVLTFMVYILRLEKYHSIVRVTVLNGLLAYMFYAGALLLELGRPWYVVNPIIGNSFGVSSVLFLVSWHFMLYMMAEFVEFSPAVAEWLGYRRLRRILGGLTLGAVVFGITLSTLHQSGLGAMFLLAKNKIHPLWYSEFIPVLFVVSSVFAGLSMVILEGTLSRRVFAHRMDEEHRAGHEGIVLGLAKICAGALFAYFFLKVLVLIHGQHWADLATGWGAWYLLEVVGLVVVPCIMFTMAARRRSLAIARWAAGLSLLGIVLNRLNVSVIAFKWNVPNHYVPSFFEIVVSAGVICTELWVFRWVVNRMPVLSASPAWAREVPEQAEAPASRPVPQEV